MKHAQQIKHRALLLVAAAVVLTMASRWIQAETGTCGGLATTLPFTDVSAGNIFFCSIAQAYFTGLTNGTTATTYSPTQPVPREQMAAFITRTQDSALRRGSRRAAAGMWATPQHVGVVNTSNIGVGAFDCFDGTDVWVPISTTGQVIRVLTNAGGIPPSEDIWTGATSAHNTIYAAGFIFVTGRETPGKIYKINPSSAGSTVQTVENNVGAQPVSITYDGLNLWTANNGGGPGPGSITSYNIVTGLESTFDLGFNQPAGIVFDGTHLWVVDGGDDALYRVNPANGAILETIDMDNIISDVAIPVFDGSNVWVPVSHAIKVVSTSTPARLLGTLTGNGLGSNNLAAAFDGERILVTNNSGSTVSLWKASSLTPLGNLNLGADLFLRGVCSDGLYFWIVANNLAGPGGFIMRF
jgi:hypothetical protein